ncbi:ABC transporter ATP-binding protein [Corynebacterium sp. Marseille-P4321]|uniref:ABC transporter ATP-binding protein n=1 Tax=Corynebacterium sp. Marseille-P4321 TaxID=2736603 RepID=UPI0034C679A2
MRRSFAANRGAAVAAFLAAAIAALAQVAQPALTGRAIDNATGNAQGSVTRVAWTMVAVAAVGYALSFLRRLSSGHLASRSQHWLRTEILRTLHRLDGPGQDRIVTGQIVSRSISDLNQYHMVLGNTPMFFTRVVTLAATLFVMLRMNASLTVLSLALLPLILWEANRSRKTLYAATWVNQHATAELAEHVEQTVSGVRVVKAFGQEAREIDTLDSLGRHLYAVKMRAAKLTARFQPVLTQLPKVALVVTIVAGGVLAVRGTITIGEFVAFTAYLTSMTSTMAMLTNQYVRLQMGMSSFDRLDDVLKLAPEDSPTEPAPPGPVGLRFSDVHFDDVLNGFDLTVHPGETVAIVGPPGAGKTMAVQLAGGFYQPDAGAVSLCPAAPDAPPLKDSAQGPESSWENEGFNAPMQNPSVAASRAASPAASAAPPAASPAASPAPSPAPSPAASRPSSTPEQTSLRQKVTCVFDDAFLFSSSVFDNIALGAKDTRNLKARVHEAARLACADEFIERLPEGFDTQVGERGLTLSGGQRQRIALARALMSAPEVLVLDDATSAIDAVTEAEILANLRNHLGSDVAVLTVAHRQSTADHADTVAVVRDGRVVSQGPREKITRTEDYRAIMSAEVGRELVDKPAPDALWPENAEPEQERVLVSTSGRASGAVNATPELLARVERLPEAREEPGLAEETLHRLRTPSSEFRVSHLFRAVRWLIAATVALLVVGVVADLAFPTLVRAAIDRGIAPADTGALARTGVAALAVVIVAWASSAAMTVLSARSGERLLYGLRLRSYAHVQQLGLSYFESRLSGKIMTRMTTDIDTLSSFLQTGLAQAIVSVATLTGVTVMLVATDGQLTLVALAAVPVIVAATWLFRRYSKRFYSAARAQISEVNGEFAELIGGIRVTQMHQAEARAEARFSEMSDLYRRLRLRSAALVAAYFPGMQFISQAMTAAIVGVGAARVAEGTLSVGVLVAFTMYLSQLYGPIQQLGQIFDSWQQATVSFDRIRELLAETTTVPDTGTDPGAQEAVRGPLTLEGVSFAYSEGADPVVEGMDVRIEPGTTVALVGPTGAGKSTVVKLLARFYDPTSGAVRASGTNIADFPLAQWRRAVAQVPQESYLFPGTVADNIAYGVPGATNAQVQEAVERIGALGVIATIPGGFNARVGERGRGLSSGQRQIIALARAEMLKPGALLLDEATATLDPATERAVLDASDRAAEGRTCVVVAHRLATAARADRILVIDGGEVVEDGPHDTLLASDGRYARMWAAHR